MSAYSIKDLEMLSNVKAHTIRTWEQRYHLFTPQRTDTNIRLYNDEELKKLLNVCTLINRGLKISKVARLTNREIADAIDKIINELTVGDEADVMVNNALIAIAAYDEEAFETTFSHCKEQLGMRNCYLKFIYPLLIRTGLMWSKDDVIPAQEHFLSNLVRRKIFAALDSLPLPVEPDQTWILFLHEQEKHELGLLFTHYILRAHGKRVIYLGQEVPAGNLENVITQCKPTHLGTFFVRSYPQHEINEMLSSLIHLFKELVICVSGVDEILENLPSDLKLVPVRDLHSLEEIIKTKKS